MVTIFPVAGKYLLEWFWGGYTINNPTLHRIYSIHFILPFIIAGLTFLHLALLHKEGSSNLIESDRSVDDINFYPFFAGKDMFALSLYLIVFGGLAFYAPNVLNHPDNCIPADSCETPLHVVPE
jgi:quinol-cytochrome oxidoreductase complex cytochrome b subunit